MVKHTLGSYCQYGDLPCRPSYCVLFLLDNAPILYSLWAAAEAAGIALGFLYASGLDDYDRTGLLVFSSSRALGVLAVLSLGFVKNTTYQWTILCVLFLQITAMVFVFVTSLAGT